MEAAEEIAVAEDYPVAMEVTSEDQLSTQGRDYLPYLPAFVSSFVDPKLFFWIRIRIRLLRKFRIQIRIRIQFRIRPNLSVTRLNQNFKLKLQH